VEQRLALFVIEVMNLIRNHQQRHHSTASVLDSHLGRAQLQMDHSQLVSEEDQISGRPVLRPGEMIQIQPSGMMPMVCRREFERAIQRSLLGTARLFRSSSCAQKAP
jgi:hypothetical protein